jgi:hypothetical protein
MIEDIIWSLPRKQCYLGLSPRCGCRRLSATVSHFTLKHILIGQHGMVLSLNNTASRGEPHPQRTPRYGLHLRGGKISVIDTNLSDVDMRNAFFV